MNINLKILDHGQGLNLPKYATPLSAGVDLEAAVDIPTTIKPGDRVLIPTGLAIALPAGFEAQIRGRSGLAYKHGIMVLNAPGTIDADYRGELKIIIGNMGSEDFIVERGMRIAQMVIAKHEQADWNIVTELDDTIRGAGGFGSTGTTG